MNRRLEPRGGLIGVLFLVFLVLGDHEKESTRQLVGTSVIGLMFVIYAALGDNAAERFTSLFLGTPHPGPRTPPESDPGHPK